MAKSCDVGNPKYRTSDSPVYQDPPVVYPPSMTDPSHTVDVDELVARHVRSGSPAHGLPYGDDLSKVGFTDLAARHAASLEELEKLEADKAESQRKAAALAADKRRAFFERASKVMKAGSPELQALAAEMTEILPGFEASSPPPDGGGSKA